MFAAGVAPSFGGVSPQGSRPVIGLPRREALTEVDAVDQDPHPVVVRAGIELDLASAIVWG